MLPSPALLDALQKRFTSVWLAAGGSEIMVTCPYCHYRGMSPDKSGHLALNFEKGMAHCVKCDWGHRNLRAWLKDQKFEGQLPLPTRDSLFKKSLPKPQFPALQVASLPPFTSPIGFNEQGVYAESLRKKKILPEEWVSERVCKCVSGRYEGYVIFPFYENGTLVYWQGRSADPSIPAWRRKQNPEELTLGKSSWLYGYEPSLPKKGVVVLVEGTLDKISTQRVLRKTKGEGYFCFGINGTAFSFPDESTHPLNSQFGKLMHLDPAEVIVLFDPDAVKKAKGLAYVLGTCGINARVAELDEAQGDPNEADEDALSCAIEKKSTPAEALREKLLRATPS